MTPFSAARELPAGFSPVWRDPERWRRLAEDARAGRTVLRLDGLLTPAFAAEIAVSVREYPFVRLETALVQGSWHQPADLPGGLLAVVKGPLRALISAVCAEELPVATHFNAWRLEPGDAMGAHTDSRQYVATLSVGLNADWTHADGGAIAFGAETPAGFLVRERWIPHLGDALLFQSRPDSWHVVESPARTRFTLTGWYVDPPRGGAWGGYGG